MNRHTEQVFNGLCGQRRTAARQLVTFSDAVSGVDFAVIRARYLHPQVARNGEHTSGVVDRIKGEKDHSVRQRVGGIRTAGVNAHYQDVDAGFAIPCLGHGERVERRRGGRWGDPGFNGSIWVSCWLVQERCAARIEDRRFGNKITGEAEEEVSTNQTQSDQYDNRS